MRRCAKCVLPETYPGIHFSDTGVCNSCLNYEAQKIEGVEVLKKRLKPFYDKRGRYHCIVGLSGGRDSTFVLYYVVKELGLNPLAVTIDNGFMPDQIYKNIERTVDILKVSHLYVKQDITASTFTTTLKAYLVKPNPALVGFLCNGCQGSIKKNLSSLAKRHNINLIIGGGGDLVGGGGEPEQSFAEGLVTKGINLKNKTLSLVLGSIRLLLGNWVLLNSPLTLLSFVREAFYRFVWNYKGLNVIGLFEYIGWNESEIDMTIKEELGWERPKEWPINWRADCKIHWLKEFLYRETLGFTKNDELLSGMVRAGMIDREEAMRRLEYANDNLPENYLGEFVKQYGLRLSDLREISHKWRVES